VLREKLGISTYLKAVRHLSHWHWHLSNYWLPTLVQCIDRKLLAIAVYRCSSLQDRDLYFREISRIKQRHSLVSSKVYQQWHASCCCSECQAVHPSAAADGGVKCRQPARSSWYIKHWRTAIYRRGGWDSFSSELVDDIITVIQRHRLRSYGHVLRKDENDWVKKCMDFGVEGVRPRGKPIVNQQICKEDAMNCRKWTKLIKDIV